jgi:DNA-binding FadR family transcriptional regulator
MAQDFRAAFGLGDNERTIATVDADGVALAAIQGLNTKVELALRERDALIASQGHELERLRTELARTSRLEAQQEEIVGLREEIAHQRAELAALRSTQEDVAALRAAMTELLRERNGGVIRTRLAP